MKGEGGCTLANLYFNIVVDVVINIFVAVPALLYVVFINNICGCVQRARSLVKGGLQLVRQSYFLMV